MQLCKSYGLRYLGYLFLVVLLLPAPARSEDADEREQAAREAAYEKKQAEYAKEQAKRHKKWELECVTAGGTTKEHKCLCPDGIELAYTDFFRCWNAPFTPDELRKQCQYKILSEPRIGAADLGIFAKDRKAKSVGELFAAMETDPIWKPFFASWLPVRRSLSAEAEAVDEDSPRRVQFRNGLIIASTAHADHPELNNLILMFEADPKTGWSPRVIDCRKGNCNYVPNPTTCNRCHGTPPRPNFASYHRWPGAYRTRGQFFSRFFDAAPATAKPRRKEAIPAAYQAFFGGEKEAIGGIDDGRSFNVFLNYWNFQIMEARMAKADHYDKLKFAQLATILGCPEIPSFLGSPESPFRKAHESRLPTPYSKLLTEVRSHMRTREAEKLALIKEFQEKDDYPDEDGLNSKAAADAEKVANLRYLFEPSGVSVKNFSLDYAKGPDTFGYQFNQFNSEKAGLAGMLCWLLPSLIESSPKELAPLGALQPRNEDLPFYSGRTFENEPEIVKKACEFLKTKSLAAIEGRHPPASSAKAPTKPSAQTLEKPVHSEGTMPR